MEIEARLTSERVVVVEVDCKYSQIPRSDIWAGSSPAHSLDNTLQGQSAEFLALLSLARVYLRPLLHRLPKL